MNVLAIVSIIGSMMAVAVSVAGLLAAIFKRGENEGRLTEILSQLTAMTADHEARLRALEKLTLEARLLVVVPAFL